MLLVILRVFQGIAVGGEWGGAALMALEHSESGKRGFAASFVNAGAPTGAVLGTLVMGAFSALPNEQFLAWGWRVPFLLSFVLLGVGMFVRLKVAESPIFKAALEQEKAEQASRTARRKDATRQRAARFPSCRSCAGPRPSSSRCWPAPRASRCRWYWRRSP